MKFHIRVTDDIMFYMQIYAFREEFKNICNTAAQSRFKFHICKIKFIRKMSRCKNTFVQLRIYKLNVKVDTVTFRE